jgi:hypothetical protein
MDDAVPAPPKEVEQRQLGDILIARFYPNKRITGLEEAFFCGMGA